MPNVYSTFVSHKPQQADIGDLKVIVTPSQSHLSAVGRQTKQAKQATISEGNYKHVYTRRLPQAATPCPSCLLPPASHPRLICQYTHAPFVTELRVILSILLGDPPGKSKFPAKCFTCLAKKMVEREKEICVCVRLWQGEVASCCLTCWLAAAFKCTLNIT